MAQIKPQYPSVRKQFIGSAIFLISFFGLLALFILPVVGSIFCVAVGTSTGWHRETAQEVFTAWSAKQDIVLDPQHPVICSRSYSERGILCQFREQGKNFVQRAWCPGWPNLFGEDTCELGTRSTVVDLDE